MISTVKAGLAAPDGALNQKPEAAREPAAATAPAPAPPAAPPPPPAAPPKSDLRLVIERDSNNAYYVYRLVDRSTGKTVVELPRDQVTDLATSPTYEAGNVVSTKA